MKRFAFVLLLWLSLAGCAAGEVADAPAATPDEATAQPTAPGVTYGRNDDGTFFYGAPDAPVTLTDYSDFL